MFSYRAAFAATILSLSAVVATGPAAAALLLYQIGNAPGFSGGYTFQFTLDTSRAPSVATSDTIRYAPTTITYTLPGSTTPIVANQSNAGPSFFLPIQQGGISLLRLPQGADLQPRFFGPALFTGTTASPNFLTGTFLLSTMPKNVPSDVQTFNYQVQVSNVVAAVPEPATWAMLIGGFGLVGGVARRRARRIVTA